MNTAAHYTLKQLSPQLLMADLERSIHFYTRQLGFEVDFRYEDFYCGIIKDGYSIHLKTGDPARRQKSDDLDVIFSVDNIEDLYNQLTVNEVNIVQPLREMPYGKEFYIADPDGHIIAFIA